MQENKCRKYLLFILLWADSLKRVFFSKMTYRRDSFSSERYPLFSVTTGYGSEIFQKKSDLNKIFESKSQKRTNTHVLPQLKALNFQLKQHKSHEKNNRILLYLTHSCIPFSGRTQKRHRRHCNGAGSFKTLVAAAKAAGLVDTLKGEGPFTVFAPPTRLSASCPNARLILSSSPRTNTNSLLF